MRPKFMTQIRSAMAIASSWSWVTNRKVVLDLALDILEEELHLLAQLDIEGGQRLVEQDEARLADDGPGQRHALALPAGELGGIAVGQRAQLDQIERLATPPRDLLARHMPRTMSP